MLTISQLDPQSQTPLYRQLYLKIKELVDSGALTDGHRLPATRELAGQLGLNRATISAAYELLESEGLIKGHVGRGSFIDIGPSGDRPSLISFSTSRPSELLFPLEEFRAACAEVIEGPEAQAILQLGSPAGYPALRSYLLEQARQEGAARDSDDILITSGCQQAFDLLQRTLTPDGQTVILEDPVYPGVKHAFERGRARVVGVPVGSDGLDLEHLERVLARENARVLVVTSNFQNPTGASLSVAARHALLHLTERAGVVLVEDDIYGQLSYAGNPPPTIKQLDGSGDTVLLRSFSKLAFPGLRVGWVIGPRPLIEKLTEAKQWSDLHTDQLSQAVLLRFAESGRLNDHRRKVIEAGRRRLDTALAACAEFLPEAASFTRPTGGMNLWVRLPEPLDSGELLARAEREGVSYLPGKYFAVSRIEPGALRISFAAPSPEKIRQGVATLGKIFTSELTRARQQARREPAVAMV
jgi:2-aminoadipate transaminase